MIDPTAPFRIEEAEKHAGWEAVKDICKRYDLDYSQVEQGLITMSALAGSMSRPDAAACKLNLLR